MKCKVKAGGREGGESFKVVCSHNSAASGSDEAALAPEGNHQQWQTHGGFPL